MMHVLSFRDVSCRFDDQRVVDAVSFDVTPGEIVCLLGPSGCGKTTSLRLAGGMETPDSGKILISGETVSAFARKRTLCLGAGFTGASCYDRF
jgi:iron(III) transport system ATP-binding protein